MCFDNVLLNEGVYFFILIDVLLILGDLLVISNSIHGFGFAIFFFFFWSLPVFLILVALKPLHITNKEELYYDQPVTPVVINFHQSLVSIHTK